MEMDYTPTSPSDDYPDGSESQERPVFSPPSQNHSPTSPKPDLGLPTFPQRSPSLLRQIYASASPGYSPTPPQYYSYTPASPVYSPTSLKPQESTQFRAISPAHTNESSMKNRPAIPRYTNESFTTASDSHADTGSNASSELSSPRDSITPPPATSMSHMTAQPLRTPSYSPLTPPFTTTPDTTPPDTTPPDTTSSGTIPLDTKPPEQESITHPLLPTLRCHTTKSPTETQSESSKMELATDEKMTDAENSTATEEADKAMTDSVAAPGEGQQHESEFEEVTTGTANTKEGTRQKPLDITAEKQKPTTPAPPVLPKLTECIVEAMKPNKKRLNKGNAAILIFLEDLSKTLLVSSDLLFDASEVLKNAAKQSTDTSGDRSIEHVFLLEANADATAAPKLKPVDGSQSIEKLKGEGYHSYTPSITIKEETSASSDDKLSPNNDVWLRAYTTFFALISLDKRTPPQKFFTKDASEDETLLVALLNIVQYLQAEDAIARPFGQLVLHWTTHRTLYPAIAAQPATWLTIGFILKQQIVYDEAFRHVAGCLPDWPREWATKCNEVSPIVMEALMARSKDLRLFRQSVDSDLLDLFLMKDSRFVKWRTEPNEYYTCNVFQEWIRTHRRILQQGEVGRTSRMGSINSSKTHHLCNHSSGCLTVAGFYRTISKGGDAYLPADDLVTGTGLLSDASFPSDDWNEAKVRKSLSEIKKEAAQIVAPLMKSGLSDAADELRYLTCMEPPEGVPWGEEDDGEEMDVDES